MTLADRSHSPSRPTLVLAQYDGPQAALHAAEKVRDAGYQHFDVHTPYPVHGMDQAMGLPDSRVGWIVLVAGLTGLLSAFAMIWWMNGVDYPLVIGGKPPKSIPSMVPVCFELTVLFSAFGAVFGMLHLNRLPRHHHPVFESDRFASFSTDQFFVSIEASDPKFEIDRTRALLEQTRPVAVEMLQGEGD